MASGKKQSVGLLVKNYIMEIGGVDTKVRLYSTTLGAYHVIIWMDWLKSHQALVDYFENKLLCNNDFGKAMIIRDLSWKFPHSLSKLPRSIIV